MDIYASDDEKGEEIKQWWRDNGRAIIVGSVLGFVLIFSGRYWLDYQKGQSENASLAYQNVVIALADEQVENASNTTQTLFDNYAKTPYAVFAGFEMAKQSVKDGDNNSAKTYLQWVMANAKLSVHQEIARLRLARILLAEADFEQALIVAKQSTSSAFSSLFAELKGDILFAQAKDAEALVAYKEAIASLEQSDSRQLLLQVKINDLAISDDS